MKHPIETTISALCLIICFINLYVFTRKFDQAWKGITVKTFLILLTILFVIADLEVLEKYTRAAIAEASTLVKECDATTPYSSNAA